MTGGFLRDDATGALIVAGATAGGDVTGLTADTQQAYKLVALFEPTRRFVPIPIDTEAPGTPASLARSIRLTSVRLSWDQVAGATAYRIYRDDALLSTVNDGPSYRDTAIDVGETYEYAVRAVDEYGQWSELSSSVTAFIDAALNVAPTVAITQWGPYIRVNASDADAQVLELALEVDAGSLSVTDDPTVWRLSA